MATCLQIVIRLPWQDASGVVTWMKTKAHRLLAAEHLADEDVKNTHIHIAIEPTVTTQAIEKQLAKHNITGNQRSIMTACMKKMDGLEKAKYEFMALAKYCIKGDKTQIKESTLDEDDHIILEQQWINRVKKYDFGAPETTLEAAAWTETERASARTGEFDKLLQAFKNKTDRLQYDITRIRKFVISFYLKQEKPPPRAGDLARYVYALYAIINKNVEEDDIQEVDSRFFDAFNRNY